MVFVETIRPAGVIQPPEGFNENWETIRPKAHVMLFDGYGLSPVFTCIACGTLPMIQLSLALSVRFRLRMFCGCQGCVLTGSHRRGGRCSRTSFFLNRLHARLRHTYLESIDSVDSRYYSPGR